MRSINPANAITLTGLVGGLVCIFCLQADYILPAIFIMPSLFLLDKLDGIVARKLNCASEMGAQLDSLADAVNFGVLIALFAFGQSGESLYVCAAGIFYAACASWRLARFNCEQSSLGYFSGLPTTNAAAWVFVALACIQWLPSLLHVGATVVVLVGAALCMVSTIKYSNRGLTTQILYLLVPISAGLFVYQALSYA